jgi:hypothetical protein
LRRPKKFAKIKWWIFWQTNEMNVMAKQSVNKSALVRDYLAKYPEKGPTAIAQQINTEKGVKVSGKFVAAVKTKLKQAPASAAVGSTPTPSAVTAAKKHPAPASVKATPARPASAPVNASALSVHIANLKAAAQRLGKDEAKRIIDLF